MKMVTLVLLGLVLICSAHKDITQVKMSKVMEIKKKQWEECSMEHKCPMTQLHNLPAAACTNGVASGYPCKHVDLLSFVTLASLGANGDGNDIWGWYDEKAKREYAIFGAYDGTSFIDITDPTNPSVKGFLPTHTVGSSWRDIKVYKNHAFIVSEAQGHGMQIFDLTQLSSLELRPIFSIENISAAAVPQLKETAFYNQGGSLGSSHNIAINEETGYAYIVGSKTCSAGLHIVDIRNPVKPVFGGCFSADGYVHDTQCVVYRGPDVRFHNHEICFCFDEDDLTIVDVTDHANQKFPILSSVSYTGYQYTHQGWLLEDQSHLLLDDELDELYGTDKRTRTLVWDVKSLTQPIRIGEYRSTETVIDHNLYVLKDRAYQANYCGGLRILDLTHANKGTLTEAAFFDVAPTCSNTQFLGSWSNYPYLPSGNIVVSSIERGLFVLKYNREN